MTERFTGTFEQLKDKLKDIPGEWKDLNPSQKQLRATSGGILNWYPATGSIMFQGKSPALEALRNAVTAAVADSAPAPSTPSAGPVTVGVAEKPSPIPAKPAAAPAVTSVSANTQPETATVASPGGFLDKPFADSELVFGLIGAVGTELEKVRSILEDRLKVVGYSVTQVRITKDVIPAIVPTNVAAGASEFERLKGLMDAGNEARRASGDNSILALGAAAFINSKRKTDASNYPQHEAKRAYIISSLKHPDEVARLREIYPQGFYLVGVHADEKRRFDYLTKDKNIPADNANALIDRDEDEDLVHGQKVTDTFHLSDFFIRIDGQDDCLKHSLWRILDLLFGNPYVTPTFDEYAMFLAFAASLRSADLSRQVGAVVAINDQVVATGANDCPKAGGGLYWPKYNPQTHEIEDQEDGRDYMRREDSNKIEQHKIITEILDKGEKAGLDRGKLETALRGSRIRDLTEFGRVVHAEMEALLSCGRARLPVKDGTVYTTTFPCHNCAKHIVATGISRVVFIEPYQKSKAAEFHTDSIEVGFVSDGTASEKRNVVSFEPFVGVGPRRFFDLFSVRLGSGYPLKRKDATGYTLEWKPDVGRLRLQMLPVSYLDLELVASDMFLKASKRKKESSNGK
jgi:deoxycytidylate deaminase